MSAPPEAAARGVHHDLPRGTEHEAHEIRWMRVLPATDTRPLASA